MTNFPDVPEREWESVSQICHSWVSYEDWDLKDLCSDEAEGGKGLRENKTIEELKTHAIENNYDGFAIFTENTYWADAVWYKKCTGVQDNHLLSHALTHQQGVKLFMQESYPC